MRHTLMIVFMYCVVTAAITEARAADAQAIRVVTGSTVVNDLTRRIGGDRVTVTCLMPAGIDPHVYQPVPEDVKRLAEATMVVINGLGFEGWYDRLAKEASFSGTLVIASAGIVPMTMTERCDHEGDHHHHHDLHDPHAFHSLALGVRYAENIRDALCLADPAGAAEIRTRAAALIASLRQCDGWARKEIARIPVAQRVIVTNHDALGYFARDYGFQIRAPNTALEDSEPSAKQVAELIDFVKAQGVKGVFLEAGKQAKVIEQVAREAGVRQGGELYLDGLGPTGGPADSYEGMWKENVTIIIRALE